MGIVLAATVLWAVMLFIARPAGSQISTVTSDVEVDRDGWFWRDNRRVNPPGTGQQQEAFPQAANRDHLQVALEGGEDDKRTFIGFSLSGLVGFEGSVVRSFTLTAEVSVPTDQHTDEHRQQAEESQTAFFPPGTTNDEAAEIVACPTTSFFAGGADGDARFEDADGDPTTEGDTRVEPDFDCGLATGNGKRAEDGTVWTFDLTDVAQVWADGGTSDTSVALKPSPDSPSSPPNEANWTVEFHDKRLKGLEATVVYTGAAQTTAFQPPETFEEVEVSGGGGAAPPPPPPPATGGTETRTPPPTPETEAQPPLERASSEGEFPWYAALPWPFGVAALAFAYASLREEAQPGGTAHRVASVIRARRNGGPPEEITSPLER